MVVKRFDPLSCAKITGTLYGMLGLVFGAVISLIAVLGGFAADRPGGPLFELLFGLGAGAVIILPIFYGCMGFVTTLLGALLYNGVARVIGGIRIEIE